MYPLSRKRVPHVFYPGDPYYPVMEQMFRMPLVAYPISFSDVMPDYPLYQSSSGCVSKAEEDLKSMMRMLWEQHVAWTRMLIISIAANLPDEQLVTRRLLRNPGDMANAIKPYYGEANASVFESLFRDHLVIAAQLVKAAKAGDSQAAADAEKRWYANADEIAYFLNSINPYWSAQDMRAMLYEHLALTKSEAVFRITNDFASDIRTYDMIELQALGMADALTDGIVKQFPDIFML